MPESETPQTEPSTAAEPLAAAAATEPAGETASRAKPATKKRAAKKRTAKKRTAKKKTPAVKEASAAKEEAAAKRTAASAHGREPEPDPPQTSKAAAAEAVSVEESAAAGADASSLSDEDREIVDNVERSLKDAVALKEWWEGGAEERCERFDVVASFNPADTSYGFFDEAPFRDGTLPVMGMIQEQLFDQPKSPRGYEAIAAAWIRDQVREYALRYFMRTADVRLPEPWIERDREPPPELLRPFDACATPEEDRRGFGYQQVYYKRRDTGRVGKFAESERGRIVDLRTIGDVYEWVVIKVSIYDFKFELKLKQPGSPRLVVPLAEESWLVMSRDFIADRAEPSEDLLGTYGLGYAFVNNPKDTSFLAYGPGEFDAAYQTIDFRVKKSGEIRAYMVFIVNRPRRIVNLSINPLDWGLKMADVMSFGMSSRLLGPVKETLSRLPGWGSGVDPILGSIQAASALTGGYSAQRLCISKEQLEKSFLLRHFLQHYQTISSALMTWRSVPDWLAEAQLPEWVTKGRAA